MEKNKEDGRSLSETPDNTSVFRTNFGDRTKLDPTSFYTLKETTPEPDWELAELGVQIFTGQAYQWQARQKSYGIFLGGEDNYWRISYERLRELTGLDINEDNFRSFVPQSKYDEWERAHAPEPPVSAPAGMGIFHGEPPVKAYYINTSARFGAYAAYFRECGDAWRVFYIFNNETGVNYLPIESESLPSEEKINGLLERSSSWTAYDRLLTQEEAAFFFNSYLSRKSNDQESWNDIYGATRTHVIEVRHSGQVVRYSENKRFFSRMDSCLQKLATRGIKFESEEPAEAPPKPVAAATDKPGAAEGAAAAGGPTPAEAPPEPVAAATDRPGPAERLLPKETFGKKLGKNPGFALLLGLFWLSVGLMAAVRDGFTWWIIPVWAFAFICIRASLRR